MSTQGFESVYSSSRGGRLLIAWDVRELPEAWPGGPLCWFLTERGPADLDLAELRFVLDGHPELGAALRVVVCLASDVSEIEVQQLMRQVAESIAWHVPDVACELEAVWLAHDREPSLGAWTARLGS